LLVKRFLTVSYTNKDEKVAIKILPTKGVKYLNFREKVLASGNEAVLPFYIFQQTIILCVGWCVIRWNKDNWPSAMILARKAAV